VECTPDQPVMSNAPEFISIVTTAFWGCILLYMSTVAEILEAVKHLPQDKKGEFLDGLREIDFEDVWDRQIEADAKAGRLDSLWREALKDIEAGRTKPLDEVINDS